MSQLIEMTITLSSDLFVSENEHDEHDLFSKVHIS